MSEDWAQKKHVASTDAMEADRRPPDDRRTNDALGVKALPEHLSTLTRTLRATLVIPLATAVMFGVAACDEGDDDSLTASGVLETETVSVASQTGGIVDTVAADVGDEVAAGDLLVELDTLALEPQLDSADAAVDAAQAALDALTADPRPEELAVAEARLGVAIAQWDGARRAWENASEAAQLGQRVPAIAVPTVAASDVVAGGSLGAALGTATGAGAGLRAAAPGEASSAGSLAGLAGNPLGEAGAAAAADGAATSLDPRAALSQAETAYRQAEVAVDAATAAIEDLKDGAGAEEIAAAEANLRQAQAARDAIEATRGKARLLSPIDGRILSRSAQPGELAMPGAALMRVTNPATTTMTVYVPENRIGDIKLDQEVEVTADAYEDETFDGTVTFIADKAEFTPRNVQTEDQRANLVFAVTITVENEDGLLRAGMPAEAKILFD